MNKRPFLHFHMSGMAPENDVLEEGFTLTEEGFSSEWNQAKRIEYMIIGRLLEDVDIMLAPKIRGWRKHLTHNLVKFHQAPNVEYPGLVDIGTLSRNAPYFNAYAECRLHFASSDGTSRTIFPPTPLKIPRGAMVLCNTFGGPFPPEVCAIIDEYLCQTTVLIQVDYDIYHVVSNGDKMTIVATMRKSPRVTRHDEWWLQCGVEHRDFDKPSRILRDGTTYYTEWKIYNALHRFGGLPATHTKGGGPFTIDGYGYYHRGVKYMHVFTDCHTGLVTKYHIYEREEAAGDIVKNGPISVFRAHSTDASYHPAHPMLDTSGKRPTIHEFASYAVTLSWCQHCRKDAKRKRDTLEEVHECDASE
jgi:hypothetical protein